MRPGCAVTICPVHRHRNVTAAALAGMMAMAYIVVMKPLTASSGFRRQPTPCAGDHDMQLTGIHHLTAISARPRDNLKFYTGLLGMRLVKKTVNQDDVSAYHLFYADGQANPGSDLTFFDWPMGRERRGTHSIVRTGLRVGSEKTLAWWKERLAKAGVQHTDI